MARNLQALAAARATSSARRGSRSAPTTATPRTSPTTATSTGWCAKAVAFGVAPEDAIVLATHQPGDAGTALRHLGAIAPGYQADLLVLPDLESLPARARAQGAAGRSARSSGPTCPSGCAQSVRIAPVARGRPRESPSDGGAIRVIGLVAGPGRDRVARRAGRRSRTALAVADPARDLAKIAVVERHLATGRVGARLRRAAPGCSAARSPRRSRTTRTTSSSSACPTTTCCARRRSGSSSSAAASSPSTDGQVVAECPLPVAGLFSGRAARRGDRAEPRLHRRGDGARLERRDAVPDAGVPRALGDPALKITDRGLVDVDRFELVPLQVSSDACSHGAHVVTMDDARHGARGRLGAASRTVSSRRSAAASRRPRRTSASTSAARSSRPGSSTRTTTCTRRSRAPGRRRPTSSRGCKTLYPVWAGDRRGVGVRGRAHRARRARALRLHDRLRPPLRLPARARAAWSRRRSARRASSACASSPRAARWTSASRDGGLPPDSLVEELDDVARRHRAARRAAGRRRPRADRRRAVLAVLGDGRADGESAELARRLGLVLHTHLAETVEEEAYCRELYGCTPVEYLELARLARGRRLVRALRPPLGRRRRALRARAARGVAHCPTSNLRLGAGVAPRARPARRRRARRPRRRRLGVERARRPLPRGEAGAARRARPRRPGGADRARRAAARHARRRGGARPRRHRLARAGQARRPRRLAHRRARARRRRRPGRGPRPLRRRTASTGCSSAARRSCATAGSSRADEDGDRARASGSRREDSPDEHLDLDPRPRHRARTARRRRPRRALRGEELARRPARPTPTAASPSSPTSSPATYRLVFRPPSPFFRRVELEVELGDGHYHVPLLVSSYACATYRGS